MRAFAGGSAAEVLKAVLHARREPWDYTALYSNTERAHDLHRTHDWVVVFFEDGGERGQATVVTEYRGDLAGERVVRGREPECATHYRALTRLALPENPMTRRMQ